MKAWSGFVLAATMVAAAGLSGCVTEGYIDTGGHVLGEAGRMAFGFAYDGQGMHMVPGHVWIDADATSNTGEVLATATLGGSEFDVHFDHFMGTADFHDGGIAVGFIEHGDTGVGDTSIPAVRLAMAGWGHATISYGGKALPDPIGGDDLWTAHFMVIENGVRNDTSGIIHTANGTGIFDPARAGDGLSVRGDHEVHLVLKSDLPEGNSSTQTFTFSNSQPINSQDYANLHAFTTMPGAEVTLDIGVTGTIPMGAGTSLTFTVRDPSGNEIDAVTISGTGSDTVSFSPTLPGEHSIDVSGQGAAAAYSISGSAVYQPIVIYMWWEDVLFGDEAAARADAIGASTHAH